MTCCSEHKSILSRKNNTDVDDQHRREFTKWFGDNVSFTTIALSCVYSILIILLFLDKLNIRYCVVDEIQTFQ